MAFLNLKESYAYNLNEFLVMELFLLEVEIRGRIFAVAFFMLCENNYFY